MKATGTRVSGKPFFLRQRPHDGTHVEEIE